MGHVCLLPKSRIWRVCSFVSLFVCSFVFLFVRLFVCSFVHMCNLHCASDPWYLLCSFVLSYVHLTLNISLFVFHLHPFHFCFTFIRGISYFSSYFKSYHLLFFSIRTFIYILIGLMSSVRLQNYVCLFVRSYVRPHPYINLVCCSHVRTPSFCSFVCIYHPPLPLSVHSYVHPPPFYVDLFVFKCSSV